MMLTTVIAIDSLQLLPFNGTAFPLEIINIMPFNATSKFHAIGNSFPADLSLSLSSDISGRSSSKH